MVFIVHAGHGLIVQNSDAVMNSVAVVAVVMLAHDFVARLQDEDVQPDAKVGGDHVHHSEPGQELVLVDVHLEQEEYLQKLVWQFD